jgi:hypothetical protein
MGGLEEPGGTRAVSEKVRHGSVRAPAAGRPNQNQATAPAHQNTNNRISQPIFGIRRTRSAGVPKQSSTAQNQMPIASKNPRTNVTVTL